MAFTIIYLDSKQVQIDVNGSRQILTVPQGLSAGMGFEVVAESAGAVAVPDHRLGPADGTDGGPGDVQPGGVEAVLQRCDARTPCQLKRSLCKLNACAGIGAMVLAQGA